MDIDYLLESDGLFETTFPDGQSFTWRLLTLKEFKRFKALKDSGAMHELILHSLVFDRCYIGNPLTLHRDLPAGITVSIGQCIMWYSGECQNSTVVSDIAEARGAYPRDALTEHMKITIWTAWPSYTEEDVESWTYQDLLRKYVIAENILSKRIEGYQPLDLKKNIIDPNTPKKRQGVAQFQELDKENRELHQALGDQRHPLDMDPAELARRQQRNQGRLSRQSARQLDQRRR